MTARRAVVSSLVPRRLASSNTFRVFTPMVFQIGQTAYEF
jgi:hypothetical protein